MISALHLLNQILPPSAIVFQVWRRAAGAAGIMATGSVAALAYGDMLPIMADEAVHPAHYPWAHSGPLSTFDTASIRRGYEVYKQVCSACHSLDRIAFRNLEGVIYDAPTVKALAVCCLLLVTTQCKSCRALNIKVVRVFPVLSTPGLLTL